MKRLKRNCFLLVWVEFSNALFRTNHAKMSYISWLHFSNYTGKKRHILSPFVSIIVIVIGISFGIFFCPFTLLKFAFGSLTGLCRWWHSEGTICKWLASCYIITKWQMVVLCIPQCHCYGWCWSTQLTLYYGILRMVSLWVVSYTGTQVNLQYWCG